MSHVFVVEIWDELVGLALEDVDGFRFFAASPRFFPLDGRIFPSFGQLKLAAHRQARTGPRPADESPPDAEAPPGGAGRRWYADQALLPA